MEPHETVPKNDTGLGGTLLLGSLEAFTSWNGLQQTCASVRSIMALAKSGESIDSEMQLARITRDLGNPQLPNEDPGSIT